MASSSRDGLLLHRVILVLCAILCMGGVGLGICLSAPAVGQWGGVLSVGLSFFMLLISRDTMTGILNRPLADPDLSGQTVEEALEHALAALTQSDDQMPPQTKPVVTALLRLKDTERHALSEGDADRAEACRVMFEDALLGLTEPRRQSVSAAFDRAYAKAVALKTEIALRVHGDWVRKQTVPLVVVSLTGTLIAGFGNVLVELALR